MNRTMRIGALLALAVLAAMAGMPVQAQEITDTVVAGSYVSIKPAAAGDWVTSFKKYFVPVIDELRTQGDVLGYHLFVPSIHHPGATYTHLVVLAYKDRAAQGRAEKRLGEVLSKMPSGEAQKFMGVVDMDKHFDIEWREIDMSKVVGAEEKKEEKKEDKK